MALTKVSTPAIKDEAITLAKLLHGDSNSNGKFLRANNGADPSFESIPAAAIASIATDGANRVLTSDGDGTATAEANLTFDNNLSLQVLQSNSAYGLLVKNTTHDSQLIIEAQAANKNSILQFADNADADVGMIDYDHNDNSLAITVNAGEALRIDSSRNLATGGVASPASSDQGNLYIKAASTIGSNGAGLNITSNAHFNSGWKHIATGAASYLQLNANGHLIYLTEASASAGSSATFDRVFKVGIDGNTILNGGIGFSANLSITDAMAKVQIMGAVHTSFTRANSYLHIGGTESHSSPGMLQTISFGHVKTSTTHAPAYIGLLTTDRNAQEKGQIEIATRDVTTDTAPTPSLIIRPSKNIVRRGPSYGIWTETVQTPNGGSRATQFIEDCYGQWIIVAKITSTGEMAGTMHSTRTLDTSYNQVTGDPNWSANWGDTYPSEVRYIMATDWEYWRETRLIDFIHGVPDDRKFKNFFLGGQSSGMPIVAGGKRGWTVAGCYDGFGRWRNPRFTNHKMSDNAGNANDPQTSESFWTDDAQSTTWNGTDDAKFIASHNDVSDGQDDNWTTGFGRDDGGTIRSDEFPNNGNNSAGTDFTDKNLWIAIKLGSPTFGHD